MSKILRNVQALRERAALLQKAVDAAPAKAAQLRDAIHSTTGQLQQLRTGVRESVAALKADGDGSLAETLVELDSSVGVFAKAGYDLTGVDLEQGGVQRLIVHLRRIEGAATESLRALMAANPGRKVTLALLSALQRAEELERQVRLSDLRFSGLIVHVGAIPTVRLCWRREDEGVEERAVPPVIPTTGAAAVAVASTVAPVATSSVTGPATMPGSSSFFTAPTGKASVVERKESGPTSPSLTPTPSRYPKQVKEVESVELTGDWRKDALARFKKMPKL
jgi:hypothetical protein